MFLTSIPGDFQIMLGKVLESRADRVLRPESLSPSLHVCMRSARSPGSLDTQAVPGSGTLSALALRLLDLYLCISGLRILLPPLPTPSRQLTKTHKMLVCFVWTGRGFPGCLVIIYWLNYISFFLLCFKKKNQIGFFTVASFLSLYFLMWRQISLFF